MVPHELLLNWENSMFGYTMVSKNTGYMKLVTYYYCWIYVLFIWYPQSLNDFRNSLSLQEINITNINCPQPSERSSVVHFCLLLCPSSFQWKIRPKNLEGVLGSIGETSCLSVEGNNNMLSLRMLFSFHSSVSISSIKKLIFWYW